MLSTNATIPLPMPGYMANRRWIQAHFDELLSDYPDQWIAVDNGRVLASGRSYSQVVEDAKRAGATPDVAREFVASAFMIL